MCANALFCAVFECQNAFVACACAFLCCGYFCAYISCVRMQFCVLLLNVRVYFLCAHVLFGATVLIFVLFLYAHAFSVCVCTFCCCCLNFCACIFSVCARTFLCCLLCVRMHFPCAHALFCAVVMCLHPLSVCTYILQCSYHVCACIFCVHMQLSVLLLCVRIHFCCAVIWVGMHFMRACALLVVFWFLFSCISSVDVHFSVLLLCVRMLILCAHALFGAVFMWTNAYSVFTCNCLYCSFVYACKICQRRHFSVLLLYLRMLKKGSKKQCFCLSFLTLGTTYFSKQNNFLTKFFRTSS